VGQDQPTGNFHLLCFLPKEMESSSAAANAAQQQDSVGGLPQIQFRGLTPGEWKKVEWKGPGRRASLLSWSVLTPTMTS